MDRRWEFRKARPAPLPSGRAVWSCIHVGQRGNLGRGLPNSLPIKSPGKGRPGQETILYNLKGVSLLCAQYFHFCCLFFSFPITISYEMFETEKSSISVNPRRSAIFGQMVKHQPFHVAPPHVFGADRKPWELGRRASSSASSGCGTRQVPETRRVTGP